MVIYFPLLKEKQILDMIFRFWRQDTILGNTDVAYVLGDSESCQLVIQKFFQGAYVTWQIQPSVLGINIVWSLWQTLTKSEHKSLRLGKKGILPAHRTLLFQKQCLTCCWIPVKLGAWLQDTRLLCKTGKVTVVSLTRSHRQVGTAVIHCDPFLSIRQSSLI